jgi:DNA (cytosine-5)-methyltransferase 1
LRKQKTRKPEPLKVISLFSGAGGLDFGLEAAGFETAVCLEMDKWCCETLRKNRDWPVIEDKVENVTSEKILETGNLKVGEAALLVGGPPCQPFSKSGYWVSGDASRLKDPRAKTLEEYMRVLEDTLPRAFILENVFGLAYKGKDEGLVYLREALERINRRKKTKYLFEWKVLNAAHYGVPQIRERVFIIGSREGESFDFPRQMFRLEDDNADLDLFTAGLPRARNAWDALGDLDDPSDSASESKVGGQWGDLLPSIPEGQNYLWHTARGSGKALFGWRSRYWSFLLKLAKNKPSWTIQAQPGTAIGPFHWKNRRLTMREMARIQTFPDDVNVLGGSSNVQKQVGNAVPSLLAEVLGRAIRAQFLSQPITGPLSLLPPDRDPMPSAERVHRVPPKYQPVQPSERSLREERQTT